MEPNEGANQGGEVSSEQPQTGGGKGWKTAIFVLVVLAVGAMAAHSVLTNGKGASPCCGSWIGGGVCAAEKVCTSNPACAGQKDACQKACCAAANKTCEKTNQCTQSKQTSDCSVSNPAKSASGCCPKPASGCCAKAEASAESE